jgi:hypothetical protein
VTGRDARDAVIEALADSEAELLERIGLLQVDVAAFSDLSRAAVHALHALTLDNDRLRAAHHRLIEAYRRLRARTMSDRNREAA